MTKRAAIVRWSSIRVLLAGAVAIAICVCVFSPALGQSDPVSLSLKAKPETIYIGDQFTITLSATYPNDYFVVFPRVPAEWGEFEVGEQISPPTTENGNGSLTSSIQIRATLFSTGEIPTPELSVAIRRPNGDIINRPVRPIYVKVEELAVGGDEEIIDIKPQAELPVPFDPLSVLDSDGGQRTVLALSLVAAIALAIAAWLVWRKFLFPTQPILISPSEMAMRELDRIESMPLETEADFKERYMLVSDCLRLYLVNRFDVPAPKLITRETLGTVGLSNDIRGMDFLSTSSEATGIRRRVDVRSPEVDSLANMLEECDLVKFARFLPGESDAIQIVERARRFARETGSVSNAEQDPTAVGVQTA